MFVYHISVHTFEKQCVCWHVYLLKKRFQCIKSEFKKTFRIKDVSKRLKIFTQTLYLLAYIALIRV